MYPGQIFHLRGSVRLEVKDNNHICVMYPMKEHRIIIEEATAKVDPDLRGLLYRYIEDSGRDGVRFNEIDAPPVYKMDESGAIVRMPFLRTKCPQASLTLEVIESFEGFSLSIKNIRCIGESETYQVACGDIFE